MGYLKPSIDCWDYVFQKTGGDYVWVNMETIEGINLIQESEKDGWRYAVIFDDEVTQNGIEYNTRIQLRSLMNRYRFFEYNGRKVQALGCNGTLCTCPTDAPDGRLTPDFGGFVYRVAKVQDGKLGCVHRLINGKPHQVVSADIEHALGVIKDTSDNPEEAMLNPAMILEYIPVTKIYSQADFLILQDTESPFNLEEISSLYPDDDEEEILLSKMDY